MQKAHAIDLLGGTVSAAAKACEISPSAVSQWPDELTKDQTDRVQAALWRKAQTAELDSVKPTAPELAHPQAA